MSDRLEAAYRYAEAIGLPEETTIWHDFARSIIQAFLDAGPPLYERAPEGDDGEPLFHGDDWDGSIPEGVYEMYYGNGDFAGWMVEVDSE